MTKHLYERKDGIIFDVEKNHMMKFKSINAAKRKSRHLQKENGKNCLRRVEHFNKLNNDTVKTYEGNFRISDE